MKMLLLLILAIVVGGFLGGIPLYMAGRILCPEVGIPVPPFGACYWAVFWFVAFGAVSTVLASVIKEVTD